MGCCRGFWYEEDDCWIVVDGKVYDATSVIEWHPGGKAAVLGHAGRYSNGLSTHD